MVRNAIQLRAWYPRAWLGVPLCLATACASTTSSGPAARSESSPRRHVIGRSIEGRAIEALSYGDGSETVLIIASIHGSEPAGTPLVDALRDWLEAKPPARRVLIVPRANPDGLARRMRHNARDVDLNRNFPIEHRAGRPHHGAAPLSEPESRALHRFIVEQAPEIIVSIHQFFSCVDYDGPASKLARRMSEACGLPVQRLGTQPGSLGAWAGEELGIATVTLELPEPVESLDPDDLWRRYGGALRAAIESPE